MTLPKYSLIKKCVLCQSNSKQWKPIFSLNQKQKLIQCQKCKLIFNDYRRIDFTQIYTNTYYDKDKNIGSGGGFNDYQKMETAFQRFYRFAYDFIIKQSQNKPKVNLLDIGCSYGFFLKLFQPDKRFFLTGIELNKQAALIAKNVCHKIYPLPFENYSPSYLFNFIVAFELIEHTLDPNQVIAKIYKLLEPGGYLLLTTPDTDSPFFKLLGDKWSSIHPAVHNFYFSQSTITQLLQRHHFRIVSIHHNQIFWSDVFHLRKRLAEMFPLFKVFFNLFSFLDSLIIPFPDGGDLQVIVQK